MSSVSRFRSTKANPSSSIPEEVVKDDSMALPMGCGQSKQAAERIIARAASHADVPATIIRFGQIAGPVRLSDEEASATPPSQKWVPSLIATSKQLGQLPSNLPDIDWIPINILARILSELLKHDLTTTTNNKTRTLVTYNVVKPHPTAWSSLLPAITETTGTPCAIVSFAEWLAKVKQHDSESGAEAQKYSVLKMFSFFEGFQLRREALKVETKRVQSASPSLSGLEPVNAG
jgi:thioester reductase-like protein